MQKMTKGKKTVYIGTENDVDIVNDISEAAMNPRKRTTIVQYFTEEQIQGMLDDGFALKIRTDQVDVVICVGGHDES